MSRDFLDYAPSYILRQGSSLEPRAFQFVLVSLCLHILSAGIIGAPSWPHGINVGAEDQTETSLVNTLPPRHLPGPPSSISVSADCFLFLEYTCPAHGLWVSFALCSKESLPNGYGNVLTRSTGETGLL